MKFVPLIVVASVIAAMPIFGWSAIPAYFNHSTTSAVLIGIACGVSLAAALVFAAL